MIFEEIVLARFVLHGKKNLLFVHITCLQIIFRKKKHANYLMYFKRSFYSIAVQLVFTLITNAIS